MVPRLSSVGDTSGLNVYTFTCWIYPWNYRCLFPEKEEGNEYLLKAASVAN